MDAAGDYPTAWCCGRVLERAKTMKETVIVRQGK